VSRVNLAGSRNVIGYVTTGLAIGHLLLVVRWNQTYISNDFRDIQWRM